MSIGLLVSLLPRTSFVSRAADDIVDAVGPVWPEQAVEQGLAPGLAVVSEVRIWAATGPDRVDALIVAGLLQGSGRELVRQVAVKIHASKLLQPYVLEFPPYRPVPGEASILQLWVSNERSNYAIFGTSARRDGIAGPTLNLNPTDQGPLAYELIWRGDGWRAALEGSWLDRLRLAGGIAAGALAVLLQRPIVRALRRARAAVQIVVAPIHGALRRAWSGPGSQWRHTTSTSRGRAFYVFPWLIPTFAILHYLANNLVILRPHEAIVPGAVIMAGVTVTYAALRLILKSAASAALFTGCLGMVFFSYGHIYVASEDQPDSRYLLGLGIPVIVGVGMLLRRRFDVPHRIGRILNFASAILIVIPLYQIGLAFFTAGVLPNSGDREGSIGLVERVDNVKAKLYPDGLRDIYFIILDAYPRSGSPASFDNSAFVEYLEGRGFYVDPQARSNYRWTPSSTTSYLTMNYLDKPVHFSSPRTEIYRVYNTVLDHTLGRILTNIGYKYVHVSSGWFMTTTSRNADVIVDFTPAGRVVSGYVEADPLTHYTYTFENAISLSNVFITKFLQTTLYKFVDSSICLDCRDLRTYNWDHPFRSIEWINYMQEVANIDGPKFVFSHFVKPHFPYSFDREGNIAHTVDSDGNMRFAEWDDEHDPTVDSAFYGQIAWLNTQLVEVIDAILSKYDDPPIIVITADHGHIPGRDGGNTHDIIAAYLLPDGGNSAIYRGISPVNIFRMILNYYFGLELERLEDEYFS